jgi:rod shape-determining protein MreB
MRITSDDVTEAIDEPLQQLIESIHGVLEHTPAELAADIFEYGILLTGGGAEMFGLCEAIADALKVPCTVAEDPQTNVVMGCGKAIENLADLGRYLDENRRRLIGR